MVASLAKQIPQNLTTFVHLFHKNPLNELHWIFFFLFVAKWQNLAKKQKIIIFA
jgi:hypothetical protein